MKKIIFFILFAALTLVAAGQPWTTVEKFEGQKISGLIVSGAFDVRISQGAETGVKVQMREDLAAKMTFEMNEDGNVRLHYGSDVGKFFTGKNRPIVDIVVSELKYLQVSGVTSVIAKGEFSAPAKSVIQIEGSSTVDFLNIKAPQIAVYVQGSAAVDAITVHTSELKFDTSGPAKATVRGEADKADLASAGASSLDVLGLQCPAITATTMGLSMIKATVSGTANVRCSATSSFRYTGTGRVEGGGKPL